MLFYSSQEEDSILYDMYFKHIGIEDGFFLELGANDGIHASNTKFLEDVLNFKGILIEASPILYNNLISNRPNTINYNYAISETKGEVEFIGHKATSGMLHTMTDAHRKVWKLDDQPIYKVPTNRIDKITKENEVKRIDLFSLDVEGGELDVVKTIDWSVPIWLFLIETTTCYGLPDGCDCWQGIVDLNIQEQIPGFLDKKEQDIELRQILVDNGFTYIMRIGGNDLWENKYNRRI